jgi:hypothetical protein
MSFRYIAFELCTCEVQATDRTIICCLSARLPPGWRAFFVWNDRMRVDNTTLKGVRVIGSKPSEIVDDSSAGHETRNS